MRNKLLLKLLTGSALASLSLAGYAADRLPITKKLNDEVIMERVQLVGVIAGGRTKDSGIAVIKDSHTGKTYAIKTGDSLPGVGHIQLHSVKRELAIFIADGKQYLVRLSIGVVEEPMPSTESNELTQEETVGPGLFEKWYGSRIGVGPDLISEKNDVQAKNLSKSETNPMVLIAPEISKAPMEKSKEDAPDPDTNVKWRRINESPLEFENSVKEHHLRDEDNGTSDSFNLEPLDEDSE